MNPIRTFSSIVHLESYLFFSIFPYFKKNPFERLTLKLKTNRRVAKSLANSLGLKIEVNGNRSNPLKPGGRLLLANHFSVLDIIALATLEDAVFITSKEMAEAPLIGTLVRMSGSLYVERRHRSERLLELERIKNALNDGRTVILFPEATSGNGEEVLRFRNGLLHSVMNLPNVEITPVCLQYETIGDEPLNRKNRDQIFLYGEISILTHLVRLFTNPPIRLKIQYLESFSSSDCIGAQAIATKAETAVRSVYQAVSKG